MKNSSSRTYVIDKNNPDPDIIKIASMYIKRGGVIIYPTDTLYGFGVDAQNHDAMLRMYKLKGMQKTKPVSILVRDIHHIEEITGTLTSEHKKITETLTPGKVTVILPVKMDSRYAITQKVKKIGFRIPDCQVSKMLVAYSKTAISSTSVNIAKSPDILEVQEMQEKFGGRVDIILDAGKISSRGSSIIDLTTTPPTLLREADISRDELEKKLKFKLRAADEGKYHILFICSGNICRSPTAAAIFRQMLARTKYNLYVDVDSAGTLPYSGAPAAEWSVAVARDAGVDISAHVSKSIDDKLLTQANLIICMALNHYQFLYQKFPGLRNKLILLKQWQKDIPLSNPSIADPIGHRFAFYEKTYAEILNELKRIFPDTIKLIKEFISKQGIEI